MQLDLLYLYMYIFYTYIQYTLLLTSKWTRRAHNLLHFFGRTNSYFVFVDIVSIAQRHTLAMFETFSPGKIWSWNLFKQDPNWLANWDEILTLK